MGQSENTAQVKKNKQDKTKAQRSCCTIVDTCLLQEASGRKNRSLEDANWDKALHAYSLCELLRGKIYVQPSGNNGVVLLGASWHGATREKAL